MADVEQSGLKSYIRCIMEDRTNTDSSARRIVGIKWVAADAMQVRHQWSANVGQQATMGDRTIDHGNVVSITDSGHNYVIELENRQDPLFVSKAAEGLELLLESTESQSTNKVHSTDPDNLLS